MMWMMVDWCDWCGVPLSAAMAIARTKRPVVDDDVDDGDGVDWSDVPLSGLVVTARCWMTSMAAMTLTLD